MKEEIKQNGRTVLSSTDGFSMPMFFNNLCGKNFLRRKSTSDYIRDIALGEMGFMPGEISLYRDGKSSQNRHNSETLNINRLNNL